MSKFLEEYATIHFEHLDINEFFNNLGMYNKISSGSYSFQQKREISSFEKFEMGKKYEFLERMSSLKEYGFLKKYISKNTSGKVLTKLLNLEREKIINQNKEEAEFFLKFIDKAAHILITESLKLPLNLRMGV